jgi:Helicase associated domain
LHPQSHRLDQDDPEWIARPSSRSLLWSWGVYSDQWEEGFSYLKDYSEREGDSRVPDDSKTDDGYRSGQWVGKQRTAKDKMDPVRRQRLEALPGWVGKVEK